MRTLLPLMMFSAIACVPAAAHAEETPDGFTLSGDSRLLVEAYDNGFRAGGPESDQVAYLRTQIYATWKRGDVEIGAELLDGRAYGDDLATPITSNEVNALEPVQAYVAVKVADQWRVVAGRQIFDLGSKRLFANPGYRNAPNAFTGIRAEWDGDKAGKATLFYMLPQDRLPADKPAIVANDVALDRESFDLAIWGGIVALPLPGRVTAEFYAFDLDERDNARRATRDRHLTTPGIRLFRKAAKQALDFELELAGQFGSVSRSTSATASKQDVEAWTAHAEAGYTFAGPAKIRLAALADWATGDDPASAAYERFDPLYGPRRGDWNPTGIYGPLGRANIRSFGVKLEAKPAKGVDAFVTWRGLRLDEAGDAFSYTKLASPSGAAGRNAGAQVETRLRWWIVPDRLQLDLGGALLMKGSFFDAFPTVPAGDTTFGYSALTITF